jgi:hypothetical protein
MITLSNPNERFSFLGGPLIELCDFHAHGNGEDLNHVPRSFFNQMSASKNHLPLHPLGRSYDHQAKRLAAAPASMQLQAGR